MYRPFASASLVGVVLLAAGGAATSAVFTVTTRADGGPGSLRNAIFQADGNGTPDIIRFAPGLSGKIIRPLTSLPPINEQPLRIDGDINSDGKPDVTLDGAVAGGTGLYVLSRENVIRGLNLRHWEQAIWIFGPAAAENRIVGNCIGTNLQGTWALANDLGVYVSGAAPSNTIGGTGPNDGNLISGNKTIGVAVNAADGTEIYGNLIGLDYTGTRSVSNHAGIVVYDSERTQIGSGTAAGRNVISGQAPQSQNGGMVRVLQDLAAQGVSVTPGGVFIVRGARNRIRGNFIGTDITGDACVGNDYVAVALDSTVSAVIGGPRAGHRNIISGNGGAVEVDTSRNTAIYNNYIGTSRNGAAALANDGDGIDVYGSLSTTIGGKAPNLRNVISGNRSDGLYVSRCTGTWIYGNYIGVSASGLRAVPNGGNGVYVYGSPDCWIGSQVAGTGNVVSANGDHGIEITGQSSVGVHVMRNIIGRNASGAGFLPNDGQGVRVDDGAVNTVVGGFGPATGNLIQCAANRAGVYFGGQSTRGGVVRNNDIFGPPSAAGLAEDGIYIDMGQQGAEFSGRLDHNTIRRFSNGIYLYGMYARPVVTANRLSACDDLIRIDHDALPNLGDLGDADSLDDGGNTFRNVTGYAVANYTPNDIKAEGNDWDTTSATTIATLIYDHDDNTSYGTVDFDPLIGGVTPTGTADGVLQLTGLAAVPAASGAEVIFTLSSPADVSVQVLNIAGRPVAALLSGPKEAGLSRLSWNGMSDRGTAAPAGTYIVRVVARDGSGGETSALGRLQLRR